LTIAKKEKSQKLVWDFICGEVGGGGRRGRSEGEVGGVIFTHMDIFDTSNKLYRIDFIGVFEFRPAADTVDFPF
jgi:hypothetical protein